MRSIYQGLATTADTANVGGVDGTVSGPILGRIDRVSRPAPKSGCTRTVGFLKIGLFVRNRTAELQ